MGRYRLNALYLFSNKDKLNITKYFPSKTENENKVNKSE